MKGELAQIITIMHIKSQNPEVIKCWYPILDFFEVEKNSNPQFIDNMS